MGGGMVEATGGGTASMTGSTQPCWACAVAVAAAAAAAVPAAQTAARDWALPKTLSATSGFTCAATGAALAIRLTITAKAASGRIELRVFIGTHLLRAKFQNRAFSSKSNNKRQTGRLSPKEVA
jgi:hypothetical protein